METLVQAISKALFTLFVSFAVMAASPKAPEPPLPPSGGALVIGEIHGSREVPDLFLALVQDHIAKGKQPIVAVELPPSAGTLICPSLPTSNLPSFWRNAFQDGRTSIAMAELICALKTLAANGDLKLLFMDDENRPGSFDSDAAKRISMLLDGSSKQAFILTGNFHSRNAPESISGQLAKLGVDTTSVTVGAPKAALWVQMQGDARGSEQSMTVNFCQAGPDSAIGFTQLESRKWDYCLNFPEMTASPPAQGH